MDRIRVIKATETPLSADVVIVEGKDVTWVYDVGCSDAAYDEIKGIANKNIVISHFHPDHISNLSRVDFHNLYVGKNTYKYTKQGIVVEEKMCFEEDISIMAIPSSHAKGSLAMQVGNECLFVGDAFYPQHKGNQRFYNVQHLRAQIELLETINVKLIGISHQADFFRDKQIVLEDLQNMFKKRVSGNPFLYV